ncbi:hypothetical protein [Streptomyces sp. SAI-127]|uniref:hypothetical protein n=1 Tax=Streptomyces sp. SAI-127 TaxID=2940543 RepID=UPI0024758E5E|nr:hypothetical protein [Streptomyces sp. SAI-127]MDH6489600.1 hypothetical protein [Streptomyces sp. SAI-127]
MDATDCVGFLAVDMPPVPPPTRPKTSALAQHLAGVLWLYADWKGDLRQCERAAEAVARTVVDLNSTNVVVRDLATEETQRLAAELADARATIDHMRKAMSWLSGHDRRGLDHLAEANHEARAREAAVGQARAWAARARTAEAALQRLTDWCDELDQTAFHVAGRTEAVRVHPVAANIRHHLAGPGGAR